MSEEQQHVPPPASEEGPASWFPLSSSKDLDPLLERIGDARFVLLGESTHGTHEYYTWRAAITRRLITEKGFDFIAVEGDWPDCYRINRYIKGFEDQEKTAAQLLSHFGRWPTWMWANWEVAALVDWLKAHNAQLKEKNKTGFYGLDMYSLWESLEMLIGYLQKTDPDAAAIAEKAMYCFDLFGKDEQEYAQHAVSAPCKDEAIELLQEIRRKAKSYDHDPEAALNTEQNARIAVEAEKYYRSMLGFNYESWNIRDRHMMSTLRRLADFHGPRSKGIVWEHNTHIGDARYTDMERAGMVNIGQLAREEFEEKNVVLVGFGAYSGTVIAGKSWKAVMRRMNMPPARQDSLETMLHRESEANRMIIFNRGRHDARFDQRLPHRAVGVVYRPEMDHYRNYVPSVISSRYDAFLYFDHTHALHPLHVEVEGGQIPETYPFEF